MLSNVTNTKDIVTDHCKDDDKGGKDNVTTSTPINSSAIKVDPPKNDYKWKWNWADVGEGMIHQHARLSKEKIGSTVSTIPKSSASIKEGAKIDQGINKTASSMDSPRKYSSPEPMDVDISVTPEQVVEIIDQLRAEKRAPGYKQGLKAAGLRKNRRSR